MRIDRADFPGTLERIGILPPLEHQDPTLLENDQLCEMVATYKRKIEELSQDKNEAPNRDQKDIKHHRARSSTPTVKPESEFREIIDLTQEFVLSLGYRNCKMRSQQLQNSS